MSEARQQALRFERLAVRRMPGIQPPGFTVDDLSAGVNVIWGPNGSGKTTLARAIEAATWPGEAAQRWRMSSGSGAASLEATFTLGEHRWRVEVEGARGRWQRDGSDRDPPLVPAAATRDRYQLCLHDLLQAQTAGGRFAEAIMRESAGGYDLAAAGESLGFRDSAGQPRKLREALRQANRDLIEAKQQQERLRSEERQLNELRTERERAAAARRRIDLLQRAIDCVRLRADLADAERDLAALPEALARMTGQEAAQLADCRAELERKQNDRRDAERDLAEAEQTLAQTQLGDDGLGEAQLAELSRRLAAAEQHEQAAATARRERRQAEGRRDQAAKLLDEQVDVGRVSRLDGAAVDRVQQVVRQVSDKQAERQGGAALADWLRGDEAEGASNASAADLAEAGRLLQRWLRDAGLAAAEGRGGADTAGRFAMIGGGLLIGAGLVAAWAVHLAAVVVAVIGAVVIAWAWRRGGGIVGGGAAVQAGAAEAHRREFERLGIDGPARWEPEPVAERLEAIQRQQADALLHERRADWRTQAQRQVQQVEQQLGELGAQRAAVLRDLGLGEIESDARLSWLIEVIARVQEADAAASGAANAEAEARRQAEAALAAIGELVGPFGYEQPRDAAEAARLVRDLEARSRAWEKARQSRQHASRRIEQIDADVENLQQRIERLFDEAGLSETDEAKLDEYCRLRERYLEAVEGRNLARRELASAEARLRELADDAEAATLTERREAELEEQLQQANAAADRWEDIHEKIIQIEQRLRQARQGHDVEEAITAREQAADALRTQREADERAVVGHVLNDFLRQEGRDRQRPGVFHEARRLLTRITCGRYRLELDEQAGDDGREAAFRAIDTTTQRGHSLDELSSGTRVQLLLAVRLAFLESQEQGVPLPLVLDETLANSDDMRAAAIIDAVLTIADEGRQVFYLTAQEDEVGKWKAALRDRDVPSAFIPLEELRREALAEDASAKRVSIQLPDRPTLPAVDGHDRESFRDALAAVGGVGRIDPRRDVGSVHLWYIVDDMRTLRRLLEMGIERWGQLREMLDHGGGELLGDDAAEQRARAVAAALEDICRNWRIGRGRPVERAALERSGAISDRFLDEVDGLCRDLGRDGDRLIAALTDGRVRNFRRNNIDELQAFFEQEGFVDEARTLTAEELRTRALAAMAREIQDGRLSVQRLEQLIAEVGEG